MNSTLDKIIFDAKVSDRKILIVPISTIRQASYNPVARTKEGVKLTKLIATIKKSGLIYPILITADRELIDGHRRLTACRALGHETIECVISPLDRDETFTAVNTNTSALGGKGWLEVGRGGGFLPPKEAKQYAELASLIGSYGIDLLIRQNLGLNILPLCKAVSQIGVKKRIEEIILITAQKRLTNKLNAELRSGNSDIKKVTAINKILREAA